MGHWRWRADNLTPDKLSAACEAALEIVPKPKCGRPPESRYLCQEKLAHGLAEAIARRGIESLRTP